MTDHSAPPTDAETLDAICRYLVWKSRGDDKRFELAEMERLGDAFSVIRRRAALPSPPKDAP